MRQQINLYQPVLIDRRQPLGASQAGWLLLAWVMVLVLVGFWAARQLQATRTEIVALTEERDAKSLRVAELEMQYPLREKDALLQAKIRELEQQIAGQKQLLGYFAGRDDRGNKGFLAMLDGLGRHRQSGLWLRQIRLDGGGLNMLLAGSALKPELVPQYLESLGEKDVLGGQVFSSLQLTALEERPGLVDFRLENRTEKNR